MVEPEQKFRDRRDAGKRLAERLRKFGSDRPVVLALPRGGVPVGFEVAKSLSAVLDVLIVRKIGAPGNPELGLGAVVDGKEPQVVLNDELVRHIAPSPDYIEAEKHKQLREIERRRKEYVGDRPAPDLKGRVIIVVDDGIATGGTVKAALRALAKEGPAALVLAVPVAPPETLAELRPLATEVVCLSSPDWFRSVGEHYHDFAQTTDAEVLRLLVEAFAWRPPASPADKAATIVQDRTSGDAVAEAGLESFPASDPPAY